MSDTYNDMDISRLYATTDNGLEWMPGVIIGRRAKNGVMDTNSVCLLFESSLRRYGTLLQALETRDLTNNFAKTRIPSRLPSGLCDAWTTILKEVRTEKHCS
jgi:hypothetical protein